MNARTGKEFTIPLKFISKLPSSFGDKKLFAFCDFKTFNSHKPQTLLKVSKLKERKIIELMYILTSSN